VRCACGNRRHGIGKDGKPTDHFQPACELLWQVHAFCRGFTRSSRPAVLITNSARFGARPATYGMRLKGAMGHRPEEASAGARHRAARAAPDSATSRRLVSLSPGQQPRSPLDSVVGLATANPYLAPFESSSANKSHPLIRTFLEAEKRVAYRGAGDHGGDCKACPSWFRGACADRMRRRFSTRRASRLARGDSRPACLPRRLR